MDRVRLTIGFVIFHHRTIIALVLMVGLGFWIYRATTAPQDKVESTDLQKLEVKELPAASLQFGASPWDSRDSIDDTRDLSSDPVVNAGQLGKNQQDSILTTGSIQELIDESLNIRDRIGENTSVVDFMLCSKRAKISRRLLQMDLPPKQKSFALVSYVESISMLDSLNVQGGLGIVGPREALLEVNEKFSDHPDQNVMSKANLAMLLVPAYDFLTSGDPELLQKFQYEFDNRFDAIINDRQAVVRLLTTTVLVNRKVGFESETLPISMHILERFGENDSPEIKQFVAGFRERLYFDNLDLESLIDRIETNDPSTREDVEKLFESLEAVPDSRLKFYLIAVEAIEKYQVLDQQNDVQRLAAWLKNICESMTNEEDRDQVLRAIEDLQL